MWSKKQHVSVEVGSSESPRQNRAARVALGKEASKAPHFWRGIGDGEHNAPRTGQGSTDAEEESGTEMYTPSSVVEQRPRSPQSQSQLCALPL